MVLETMTGYALADPDGTVIADQRRRSPDQRSLLPRRISPVRSPFPAPTT